MRELSSIVFFLSCIVIPIISSLLRFAPWPTTWINAVNGYVIYPPVMGRKHSRLVLSGLGVMVPTRGQALLIISVYINSLVISIWDVESQQALQRSRNASLEYSLAGIANRQGVLALSLLPLVILYSGRNNPLLWITNWSQSTFSLLHRWMAVLCMIHAAAHSLIYLYLATASTNQDVRQTYHQVKTSPGWRWGSTGTVAMSMMVPLSLHLFRRRWYEVFRITHVVLIIAVIAGSYQHIRQSSCSKSVTTNQKSAQSCYQLIWLYLTIAFWSFEHCMRLLRIFRSGTLNRAYISPIDDEYYQIRVPVHGNCMASYVHRPSHAYLYFPSMTPWRPWESHPFSIANLGRIDTLQSDGDPDSEKQNIGKQTSRASPRYEVTFLLKKRKGLTSLLHSRGKASASRQSEHSVRVLFEGPYVPAPFMLPHRIIGKPPNESSRLVCIAGGVGIAGVQPALREFSQPPFSAEGDSASLPIGGCCKLYWGVRAVALVDAVEKMMTEGQALQFPPAAGKLTRRWGAVDVEIATRERTDVRRVLEQELCPQQATGKVTVVVCGPPGMSDEVRCTVAGILRSRTFENACQISLFVHEFPY